MRQAQELYRAGQFVILKHAQDQMRARNVGRRDLENGILNASGCRAGHSGRWMIEGQDIDGDSLTVVVEIRSNLLVVTVRE